MALRWPSSLSCVARTIPSTTGSTAPRWARIRRERQADFATVVQNALTSRALVILHVAFVRGNSGCTEPSNAAKILSQVSDHVREHVQTPAMGHAKRDVLDAACGAPSIRRSSTGITVSQPSSEKRFWPRYFVCRKRSNCSAEIFRADVSSRQPESVAVRQTHA